MKKLFLMPLLAAFCASCWAQGMFPHYDSYTTYSMDSNLKIYQTVVVEGYTAGSCNYVCGPNNQQCTIAGCSSAVHTPRINNVIGGVGGWSTGPASSPFSYLSYQTTTSVQGTAGHQDSASTEGDVLCSGLGLLFGSGGGGHVGASETNYTYAPPPSGNVCAYNKNCPVGQTATCGAGTLYQSVPCTPQFYELYFAWYNFGAGTVCVGFPIAFGSSLPGNCD
jgi:hypothetical protein